MFNFFKKKSEAMDNVFWEDMEVNNTKVINEILNKEPVEVVDEVEEQVEEKEPELTAEQKLAIVEATLKAAEERINKLEEKAAKEKAYHDKLEALNSKLVAQIKTYEETLKNGQKKDGESVAADRNNNLSGMIKELRNRNDDLIVKSKITLKNAAEILGKLEKIGVEKLNSADKIAISGSKALLKKIVERHQK